MNQSKPHILMFPYPAQGHMIPLLDLTHHLSDLGLAITILLTPKNLPLFKPLLSKHPSIQTLVLPLPPNPAIPAGVENVRDLSPTGFRGMICALGELYQPIVDWFSTHPSPPTAIVADMFVGWAHRLARHLGIPGYVFSPSGAMALSIVNSLWREMPKPKTPGDKNETIEFSRVPNCPKYPWWQLSPIYRRVLKNSGQPDCEFIKNVFRSNLDSYGLVINSFDGLERVYLDHLKNNFGHDRVWAVGPVLPEKEEERGGSYSVLTNEVNSWLDRCEEGSVLYVCFGSQAVLTNKQMEGLALGLEKSGIKFVWSVKEATGEHAPGDYGTVPAGFEERVAGRGFVIKGWAPQVLILSHKSVGWFLTHCGWNSVLESIVAGVPMLAWPMGADQFSNATLLVDELRVATRVCEGPETVPDSHLLAELLAEVMQGNRAERARAAELREAALLAVRDSGSSYKSIHGLVVHFCEEASKRFK